jgi:hypothetical protein
MLRTSLMGCLHVPHDSVYDFLHKVVCNLNFNQFFLKCVDKPAVVIGVQRIIKTLNILYANCA